MRHAISGNRLGRNSSWRKATVRDIAKATIIQERICTTKAKAKEARKLVDRLITLGKKGTLAHRRKAFSILCDHKIVSDLFNITAPRFKHRNGGYTRIIPLATRRGDNAEMVYLEITEKKEIILRKSKASPVSKGKALAAMKDKDSKKASPEAPSADTATETKTPSKGSSTKGTKTTEKGKSGKKFVGGIKKIFRRKQTD